MNLDTLKDFQICISVPLRMNIEKTKKTQLLYDRNSIWWTYCQKSESNCSVNVKVEFKRDCGVLEEMDFFLPW